MARLEAMDPRGDRYLDGGEWSMFSLLKSKAVAAVDRVIRGFVVPLLVIMFCNMLVCLMFSGKTDTLQIAFASLFLAIVFFIATP